MSWDCKWADPTRLDCPSGTHSCPSAMPPRAACAELVETLRTRLQDAAPLVNEQMALEY